MADNPLKINRPDGEEALYRALPSLLLPWYRLHARPLPWRRDREPYHVWVSEIMLQQTRAEVVKDYYLRFLQAFPDVQALAAAPEERLLKLWEGLGYYSRARNLQKAARMVVFERGGSFPDTYGELLTLPGVGPYTAGAIASICFERPVPAVDGNVLRILARMLALSEPIDAPAVKKRIARSLAAVYPEEDRGAFTQSLMELGATVCLPAGPPRCALCPLSPLCAAFQAGAALDFPKRREKKSRKAEKITVFLLSCRGKLAVRRRGESGLLAGLWEFPNEEGELSEQQALNLAARWGAAPLRLTKSQRRTHIFTHIKWEMTAYFIDCAAEASFFTWAEASELSKTYPLPTAFKMFLP